MDRLAKWLEQIVSPPGGVALDKDPYDEGLELLIEMAQLEIIKKELPKVYADAAAEHYAWNQFEVYDQQGNPTGAFVPVSGVVDAHVAANAALEISRAAVNQPGGSR